MAKLFDRTSTSMTISEFNERLKQYRFDVEYQRKSGVWSEEKKSFLIDSIMKNYPIPAIFLRPTVDEDTGKTTYDIVDGKQRLETIIQFINDKIPLTTYFAEDDFIDGENLEIAEKMAGLYFSEIKANKEEFSDYIKQFWTYSLNIDYLYETNEEMVASVFDRLNRNGEPLTKQELRNAKYAKTPLLNKMKMVSEEDFFKTRLKRLKSDRMEDVEFVSELFFLIAENKILDSSRDDLDALYDKYGNSDDIDNIYQNMKHVMDYIEQLELENINKRLNWTTHFYSLFSFAWKMNQKNIKAEDVKKKLAQFYEEYFSRSTEYKGYMKEYKEAASSRTRSESQRCKRLEALEKFCGITCGD